ncbi:hypothetical protein GH5_04566 [Leishmania sp. Ghana 2012 LV757]|uniref:hypothetical protein n=1 Tax=Leishmania sp. Ghana 2012 LV757 TaxID=2803181 RepID=UPI001B44CCE3|nr:hypothetical protein GH5_04566 [Leishmania sp. Ghana 2012 LV757]
MGRTRVSQHGAATEGATGSSPVATQRAGSSLDMWTEGALEDASRRSAHHKKSVTAPRDQLLYLQALYPYALSDELVAIISNTDSTDEAAKRAYGALNPDYGGFHYLKEQHDLSTSAKLPGAKRATAFEGLKESLQERAANAFRSGNFSNLSQLQEYQETVGLFIVDTSDWDRAMLLPSRGLGEMVYMDLPLSEEPANYEAVTTTIDGDNDDGSEWRRDGRWRVHSVSLATPNSATGVVDRQSSSTLHAVGNTASTPQWGGKADNVSCAQLCGAADERPTGRRNGDGAAGDDDDNVTASVVYLQSNNPPCEAPIIAWAPEAIRVEPAEARREREGALRVFDEAAFFRDSLLQVEAPPPSHWARVRKNTSSLDRVMTASSAADGEVHEPAMSVPPGGRSSGTAALPAPQRVVLPLVDESEVHEPFGLCDTPAPHLREHNGIDDENTRELFNAEVPPALRSPRRTSSRVRAAFVDAQAGTSVSAANGTAGGTRRISGAFTTSALQAQSSMRDAARKALETRNPHPLTTSEKVRQRMRSLSPVGNLIFRENSPYTPVLLPQQLNGRSKRPGEQTSAFFITAQVTQQHQAVALDGCEDSAAGDRDAAGRDAEEPGSEWLSNTATVGIPAAHSGCSSLDPAAFLNAEEERWETVVMMLVPYEQVFGSKLRCELVRCIYNDCPKLRENVTVILKRLLRVVGKALREKELAEGMSEELLEVPFFGSILLSTSAIKLTDLSFREEKCSLEFCEGGSRLKVKLDLEVMSLEPIRFAYISEADAARQARKALQWQRGVSVPSSREAVCSLRSKQPEQYTEGVTRGTATVKAANVRIKGLVYVWLMASGKTHIAFQKTNVSVGSFRISTTVTKLNILCTLGAPIFRLMIQRGIKKALQRVHTV